MLAGIYSRCVQADFEDKRVAKEAETMCQVKRSAAAGETNGSSRVDVKDSSTKPRGQHVILQCVPLTGCQAHEVFVQV